jgi:hypothetical protein
MIVLKDDSMQWGVAVVAPTPPAEIERLAANLTPVFDKPRERTVNLKYTLQGKSPMGPFTIKTEADMLEVMTPTPDQGGQAKTAFGNINFTIEAGGQKNPLAPQILDVVKTIPTTYTFDLSGKVKARDYRQPSAPTPKQVKDAATDVLYQLGTAYEATLAPMPGKEVQPDDNWPSSDLVVPFRDMQKNSNLKVELYNFYRGVKTRDNRKEAIIGVAGKLKATDQAFKKFEADFLGTIGFDTTNGFISSAQLKLASPADAADQDKYTLDIDLTRSAGNSLKIQLP